MVDPSLDRRQLLLGGVLGGAGLLAMATQPRARDDELSPSADLDALIPPVIGAYRLAGTEGLVLPPPTPAVQRAYVDVVTRLYRAPNRPTVMLLIARGAASAPGLSVHRPDRCYPAAGFDLGPARSVRLTGPVPTDARATYVAARRGARLEHIYFWVRVGDRFPTTGWDQRMATIDANLRGWMPQTVLGRLSVVGDREAASLAQLMAFNERLLSELPPPALRLMLGA